MYQASLVEGSMRRTAMPVGRGAFSSVYRMTNGKIVKVGQNDGTRNWLEFCMLRREAGTLMPMMPEVYCVTSIGDRHYIATMEEYAPSDEFSTAFFDAIASSDFGQVRASFVKYLEALSGREFTKREAFNDIHSGNIMVCPRRGGIVTDPSAFDYITNSVTDFTLQ